MVRRRRMLRSEKGLLRAFPFFDGTLTLPAFDLNGLFFFIGTCVLGMLRHEYAFLPRSPEKPGLFGKTAD